MLKKDFGVYFLSRPRRYGKSLLISTLNEIFLGNKELFKGLFIYETNYNWKKYPIIRIDFSKQKAENKEQLKNFIIHQIDLIAKNYEISLTSREYFARFQELILALKEFGKIVILIDEYDKPIIDYIEEPEIAKEMREVLKGFYLLNLDRIELSESHFSTYDIERLEVIPLLFQTGYLTLKGYDSDLESYILGYPNISKDKTFQIISVLKINEMGI